MSEKIQIGIYRIKEEIFEVQKNKKPKNIIVDIKYLTKVFKEKGFKQQDVIPDLNKNFELYLYFKRNNSPIQWKEFIEKIAISNEPILKHRDTYSESYILLLLNIKSGKIYATTGGFGHTALQGLAENDFGLEILSRLVNAEDKTLRSTKEKNLTGGILGEVKFFRNDYNFNENENFGNFYQELHSSLNKSLLINIFGFSLNEIDSECLCIAKNSFTIKKSISFDQLITIIEKCEYLINNVTPVVEINAVKKLDKSNKSLIIELESLLKKVINDQYNGITNDISIELCHKNFDKYLHADNFILSYTINGSNRERKFDDPIKNISEVVEDIRSVDSTLSVSKIEKIISYAHIISKGSNGEELTSDLLENHFYTEVRHKGKSYFLSDREWFEIKPSLIQKLDEQCQSFINKNIFSKQLEKWAYQNETENEFNAKHIGLTNFLVFDRFTPENIEPCDILHWDNNNVYFIHVKAGFDNSMRDLSHQIYIAARRIKEDFNTGFSFIEKLYDKVHDTKGNKPYNIKAKNQLNKYSKDDFISLFKTRKLNFVLAVLDTAVIQRNLSNIDLYESNIAKFSLHELVKNMRNLDVDFLIYEIEKEQILIRTIPPKKTTNKLKVKP
jgi:uncharacterized protein (TIGR04141 family)